MNLKYFCTLFFVCTLIFTAQPLPAMLKSRPTFRSKEDANIYLRDRYNRGAKYFNKKDWKNAATEFEKVIYVFPATQEAAEAHYFLGVCYFQLMEYDFANGVFTDYLKLASPPKYFDDVINYKFCIAEYFKNGHRRRLLKVKYLPKWGSAQDMALETFDEIIVAVPNQELAAQSLYSKAGLLLRMKEFRDCIEAHQTLIRRFPKHELAPQCYLDITEAYFENCKLDFQNPDLLALAELNVRKFKEDFPRDERICEAEEFIIEIKELYAKGLYDTGSFYERLGAPAAAAIYYRSSIEEFPDTKIAQLSREKLQFLPNTIQELEEEGDTKEIVDSNEPEEPMPFDAEVVYPEIDPLSSNRLLTDQ